MNGFLWTALAVLVLGLLLLGFAWWQSRSATSPDDYGNLVGGILIIAVFGGASCLLAIVGLIVKAVT